MGVDTETHSQTLYTERESNIEVSTGYPCLEFGESIRRKGRKIVKDNSIQFIEHKKVELVPTWNPHPYAIVASVGKYFAGY